MSMNQLHTKETRTVGDWIQEAAQQFEAADLCFGHGTDNAWDEAVQLVMHVLKEPPDSNASVSARGVSESQAEQIVALIQERIKTRKPLPYLTHQAWFMGMPFYVDERVLVPRSPFAEWIERAFSPWIDSARVTRILDMGTGSGCLAIACATVFPHAIVDATDIDKEALAVAAINVSQYQLSDRVQLIQSDGFTALADRRYDVIISNPPYVGRKEMNRLPKEYRHEPKNALEADDEGLAIAIRLLKEAKNHLTEHGIFLMEVGYNAEALQARFPNVPFMWLEQERGGEGLLLLDKKQLSDYF